MQFRKGVKARDAQCGALILNAAPIGRKSGRSLANPGKMALQTRDAQHGTLLPDAAPSESQPKTSTILADSKGEPKATTKEDVI
jgi:hypothetical protein